MKNSRMQAWLTRPDGLATLLRTARGGQSVRQLADKVGWQSSKVSRIETGGQIPTADDVKAWAKATNLDADQRKALFDELDEAASMRSTFRRRQDSIQVESQSESNHLESVASFVRIVQPGIVPALLQTGEYARALIEQGDPGVDVDKALADLMRRQAHLLDPAKRFEFVVGEAALRYIPSRVEVMGAQFDRLISASDLRNVRLGIVPMLQPLSSMPGPAPFALYDSNDAVIEDGIEGHQYTGAAVSRLQERLDRLWTDAVEGEAARALILAAKAAMPTS